MRVIAATLSFFFSLGPAFGAPLEVARVAPASPAWVGALKESGLSIPNRQAYDVMAAALRGAGVTLAQMRALPGESAAVRTHVLALAAGAAREQAEQAAAQAVSAAASIDASRLDGPQAKELRSQLRYFDAAYAPFLSEESARATRQALRPLRQAVQDRTLRAAATIAEEIASEKVVRSELPESASWKLIDRGPILGRFLHPRGKKYGGQRYPDLMNPTTWRDYFAARDNKSNKPLRLEPLESADGKREWESDGKIFMLVRAARDGYTTKYNADGIRTLNYHSDVLLFQLVGPNRRPVFRKLLLKNVEDPRVSFFINIVRDSKGRFMKQEVAYLGVTDYSPHGGMKEPTAMDAFVRVVPGKEGVPELESDGQGKPKLFELSPEPILLKDGTYAVVDAKDGILAKNNYGQLRNLARHRYQQNDPRLPPDFKVSRYAQQIFPLNPDFMTNKPDWAAFMKEAARYEVLRDSSLEEHYPADSIWPDTGKAVGPGTAPIRFKRRGQLISVSYGYGYGWTPAGKIPPGAPSIIKDGETIFFSWDHEARTLKVAEKRKRVYTLSAKRWHKSLDKITGYYPDLVQPTEVYETQNPGIPDLWHIYPTGLIINADGTVDTYEGTADGNVVRRRWDIARLVVELATRPGSR